MIDGWFAGDEVFHAARGIEQHQEVEDEQGGVGEECISDECRHGDSLRLNDEVAQQEAEREAKGEDEIVGCHAPPVDSNTLVESAGEEEVGFPEQCDEEDADDFPQQDAHDAVEGSEA